MNIVLDPLFIFGFGWGTVGAALATPWLSEAVFGIFVYKLRGKAPCSEVSPLSFR